MFYGGCMKIVGSHDELMLLKLQCERSHCAVCVLRVFCKSPEVGSILKLLEYEEIEKTQSIFIAKGDK
jgi:hypothetical protein